MTFKSLLPVHLTKELEPYKEAFDFALDPKNKDITNIAVTGNYGAGKSSVISSYFRERSNNIFVKAWIFIKNKIKRKKTLTISLANFVLKKSDTKNTDSTDENVQKIQNIEFSILQQLLHKAHPNKLPKSRFERIVHKYSKSLYLSVFINLIYIVMFVLSLLLISNWSALVDKLDFTDFYKQTSFLLVPIILLIALMYYLVEYLVDSGFVNKQDIQSIDLLKGQATFKNRREQSVLNLFLDEILYFFEATHYTTIIFEDLDRLEHKEIFIRLREINHIINSSDQINRPIKFIYAVKDDLFENQESRVKFFDFIIPIIPVMDFDNSYKHLQTEIKRLDVKVFEALDEGSLLRDISDRINDMRLLINIVNEYTIYLEKEKTSDIETSQTITNQRLRKIFALIVYKNFMPEDFSLIQSKKSILCQIVNDYRTEILLKDILTNWKNEKDSVMEEIQSLRKFQNRTLKDLKIDMINKLLFSEAITSQNIYTGPNYYHKTIFDDAMKIDFFDTKLERDTYLNPQTFYSDDNNSFTSPKISSDIINSYLDEYHQNQQLLTDDSDERLGELEEELAAIDFKIKKRHSFTEMIRILQEEDPTNEWEKKYYQLETPENIEQQENHSDQLVNIRPKYKIKPIIFMLIRKGYIDHTYINYLSLSHESAAELREFRNAISDNLNFEHTFDLPLTETTLKKFLIEEEYILSEHARNQAILNFSLINYLLKQKNTTGPAIQGDILLSDILNFHYLSDKFNLNFLTKYINECLSHTEYKPYTLQLIQEIFIKNKSFQHLFKTIPSQNFNDLSDDIRTILLLILIKIDIDPQSRFIEKFKPILVSIPNFINGFDYLELHNQPVDNVISWLQEAKIKIDLMTPSTDTNSFSYKLFRAVIDNSLYKITDKNIIHIFEYDGYSTEELKTMHYSTLCTKYDSDTHMLRYIEENISTYVNNILIAKKLSTQETPENIMALINNKFLDNNQRIEIIKQNTSFIIEKNLSDIEFEEIIQCIENDISFGQQLLELDLEYRKQNKFLIKPTWLNTYRLLTQNELISQDNQASWLNVIYNNISMIEGITEDQKPEFKDIIIFNDQLSNDAYKHLVNLLQLEVTNGDLEKLIKLQWEKIQILMELQLVKLSQESVDMIYETFINPTQEEEEND